MKRNLSASILKDLGPYPKKKSVTAVLSLASAVGHSYGRCGANPDSHHRTIMTVSPNATEAPAESFAPIGLQISNYRVRPMRWTIEDDDALDHEDRQTLPTPTACRVGWDSGRHLPGVPATGQHWSQVTTRHQASRRLGGHRNGVWLRGIGSQEPLIGP
jgi:hypothetical protein